MKPRFRASILLLFAFLLSGLRPAAAQWQAAGPAWESISSFAYDADYVYAGSAQHTGVYRSADGGRTWTSFSQGLLNRNEIRPIASLAAGAGVLLAGTDNGPYRSVDQGQTWTASATGLPASSYIDQLAYAHGAFFTLAGSSSTRRVYRSTDGGASWTALPEDAVRASSIVALLGAADTLFIVGQRASGQPRSLILSADGGATFTSREIPRMGSSVPGGPLAYSNGRLFLGEQTYGHIYHTDNAGATWTRGTESKQVVGMGAHGATVVAATKAGILTSTDHGATWTQATEWLPDYSPNAKFHGPTWTGAAFHLTSDGLYPFRSADGLTWEPASLGMAQQRLLGGLVARGDTLLAGDNLGLYWSNDGGRRWYAPTIPTSTGVIQALAATDSTFIAIGQAQVLRSTDGRTWQQIATTNNWTAQRAFVTDDAIYAATQKAGLLKSTDGGYTWTPLGGSKLIDVAVRGDVILVADATPVTPILRVSTDGGQTWSYPADVKAGSVAATEAMFFSAVGGVFAQPKLWRSPDGITWTLLTPPGVIERLYAHGSTLFASLRNGDVHWSTDEGVTWQSERTGLPAGAEATHFLVSGDTLYMGGEAGPGVGIYRLTLPTGVLTANAPEAPVETILLHQAQPNPLTTSTALSFTLAAPAHVHLAIYDLLGREVAVLAAGLQAAGTSHHTWHADGQASGHYLVRLQVGGRVSTRVLTLLR